MYFNLKIQNLNIILFLIVLINFNNSFSLNENISDKINALSHTWKAKENNFIPFFGLLPLSNDTHPVIKFSEEDYKQLPENFDARNKWTNCESVGQLRNQGCCHSCWAASATAAMTDRLCIHSNGTFKINISLEDTLECAPGTNGCEGGHLFSAFDFWATRGIVSGGGYQSNEGCKPYSIPHRQLPICDSTPLTPICVDKCSNQNYLKSFKNDLTYGKQVSMLLTENDAKMEIYKNGPIITGFDVYEDFDYYSSGVYKHVYGNITGTHAVKLIGWGVTSDGTKYWLAANSWGEPWGEKGYFRMLRGVNECGFENAFATVLPDI